jgi:hypothetical protein
VKACTRRAVAYIAGTLITGQKSAAVYDYQDKRHVSMSGAVTANSISVYDYDQHCHIAGSGTSLYHYGNHAHFTLQLNGASFSGYDYDSKAHFSGTANSRNMTIYDYEAKAHYNYSI